MNIERIFKECGYNPEKSGIFLKIGLDRLARIWYYILERRIEHENSNHAERSGSLDGRRAAYRVSNRR